MPRRFLFSSPLEGYGFLECECEEKAFFGVFHFNERTQIQFA